MFIVFAAETEVFAPGKWNPLQRIVILWAASDESEADILLPTPASILPMMISVIPVAVSTPSCPDVALFAVEIDMLAEETVDWTRQPFILSPEPDIPDWEIEELQADVPKSTLAPMVSAK